MESASGWDVEIFIPAVLAGIDTWFGVSLVQQRNAQGKPQLPAFTDILAASDADAPVTETLHSRVQQSWYGGVGVAYNHAPGVFTRNSGARKGEEEQTAEESPGYACPAGAVTEVAIPAPASGSLDQFVQYGNDIFIAQVGTVGQPGRVLRIVSPYTAVTVAQAGSAAGHYCRGLAVANGILYAMFSDGGIQNGEMYSWNGAIWTGPIGMGAANGRGYSVKVEWRGRDGLRNNAIVTVSGPRQIAYTKPGADPMAGAGAGWIDGVVINTTGQIRTLAASRGHVFIGCDDNVYDLDEVGNTVSLTSYSSLQTGNGYAMEYLDGSLFYSRGDGLDRIIVERSNQLQETPGQCRPGYQTGAEVPPGYSTALAVDDGCLVNATFDPVSKSSNVYWGKSRESVRLVNTPCPMVWWGPELVFTSDLHVGKMFPTTLGSKRIWVATTAEVAGTPRLFWQSLPQSGDPLQDLSVGGSHRVCTENPAAAPVQPYSRIYSLRLTAGDKTSKTDLNSHVVGSRYLGSGTKLTLYHRADAVVGGSWGTGDDIPTSPVQSVVPVNVTQGYVVEQRIDFTAPNGNTAPGVAPTIPVLDSVRDTFWKLVPDSNVRQMDVAYGDDVNNLGGGSAGTHGPDLISTWLQQLMDNGTRTTLRDSLGNRYTVRFRQLLTKETTLGTKGPWGKRVETRLQAVIIAGPL